MTQAEWLACADPMLMLKFLQRKATDRKLRLFACACCRSVSEKLMDGRSRIDLEAAENYADEAESLAKASEAREVSLRAMEDAAGDSESAELGHTKWHAACAVVCCTEIPCSWEIAGYASQEIRQAESCYLFETANEGVAVRMALPWQS